MSGNLPQSNKLDFSNFKSPSIQEVIERTEKYIKIEEIDMTMEQALKESLSLSQMNLTHLPIAYGTNTQISHTKAWT